MQLNLTNSTKSLSVSDEIFANEFKEALIHQVVVAQMNAARAGTKAQKTRAEVRGGGSKPFKQKGTGRARAGTIRSPLWRKGGVVFAAKPRSYKQKVNKKMFKIAVRSILSELIRQERILIVDGFQVDTPKTKALLKKLNELNVNGRALIISHDIDENLYLAIRNVPELLLMDPATAVADPVALVGIEKIIITETAIKEIEELLR